jgi:hypothetical protein
MTGIRAAFMLLSLVVTVSCGGMSALSPVSPSATVVPGVTGPSPVAPTPRAGLPTTRAISGVVGPLRDGTAPCWADRYPCEVYDFALLEPGSIAVTVNWEGQPRDLMVQLYWAGGGLAHEDVAPRTGPSSISFRRPMMEAASYRLRVVSLAPTATIPFALTITF